MKAVKKIMLFIVWITLSGCTYTFPEVDSPTAGSADFTKIISVGNSITSGYANGALYDEGQEFSFVNILAGQVNLVTPITYNQPDINSPVGYSGTLPDGTPMGRLILVNPDNPFPSPIIPGDAFNETYIGDKSAINNFGVPGLRLIDVDITGYALENPYFKRFAMDVNSSSVLGDAVAANSTFFTFWLGNNDVLGFATAGASGNPDGDGSSSDDLISSTLFNQKYEPIVNELIANGAKGVIANIPNVTDIPFFTTVPIDLIYFDNSDPADTLLMYQLNQDYQSYNQGLKEAQNNNDIDQDEADSREIVFKAGNNGVLIFDESLTDLTSQGLASIRMATTDDLLTIYAALVVGQDLGDGLLGTEIPLPDQYTLTPDEQAMVLARTTEFNDIIQATVNNHAESLALVDINAIFKEFAESGVDINGSGLTASIFPPFGGFSLDGVHPNPRGAAYITNQFIEAINNKFGAIIPLTNPNNYPGNELPVLP